MNKSRFFKIEIHTPLTSKVYFYTTLKPESKSVIQKEVEHRAITCLASVINKDFEEISGDMATYALSSGYDIEEIDYEEYMKYMHYFLAVGVN